jgi:N-acetylglucosamine kinase-like BadF-type ATPase
MRVLGIDAGGTKTLALLADEHGEVLNEARGAGVNLQSAGELAVEKVLHEIMVQALDGHHERPVTVCIGIAGVDRQDDARTVAALMRRISQGSRVLVVNDALIALVAGAGSEPGIVIVAGTGSIAYGKNAAGHAARAGGWGHLIGDEGSGYWIGSRALSAVVRDVDGRGPHTRLTGAVLEFFGVADAAGLVRIVYDRDVPRRNVAGLGPIVQRALDDGDMVATEIVDLAAGELALAAGSVASRLGMRGDKFPFLLSGSAFKVVPRLAAELGKRLVEIAPRARAELLTVEPALGAVMLAIAEARGGALVPTYLE